MSQRETSVPERSAAWAIDQAQGRSALHPRPGQLRRRHQAARAWCTWTSCAALCARQDQGHRHRRRRWRFPASLAVITGETSKQYKLHWMPTLMSDTQMVLPVDKVMYQAQEVAAVIATDRYTSRGRRRAVEVDYEPLPPVVDPFKALNPTRPCCAPTRREERQPHLALGGRRPRRDRPGIRRGRRRRQRGHLHPAHPRRVDRDLWLRRRFRRVEGKLTVYMTTQAPHAIRTVFALVAGSRCRSRKFGSSRRTSAADSAARCRSIPAT